MPSRIWLFVLPLLLAAAYSAPRAQTPAIAPSTSITLNIRDTAITEVFEMLSRQGRMNILLGKGVTGNVSVNLYQVKLEDAVRAIAESGGFVAEYRTGSWFVVVPDDVGKRALGGVTEVRTFKVQYSDPEVVATLLEKHLSRFGKATTMKTRSLLVIEDSPEFLDRIGRLIDQIDVEPTQILIEAQILEIGLDADQTYGIDWRVPFQLEGGLGALGAQGLAPTSLAGLFVDIVTPNFDLFINALRGKGRVRTLSTPKLLVLENQEAAVIVGDRIGFKVTTTINQVTTESIEFLESGVILKVSAAVDRTGRVLLKVHPEVSTGTVTDGIPSLTTTEVTTQMLAEDGQRIFIGGLIKNSDTESRSGVPGLSEIPLLGGLFSRTEERTVNSETVIVITPHIMTRDREAISAANVRQVERQQRELGLKKEWALQSLPSARSPIPAFGGGREPEPMGEAAGASPSATRHVHELLN